MSAALQIPQGIGYAGLRMTADEYLALGQTQERYELIDGVVVMSPSPDVPHVEIATELVYQMKAFARGTGARVLSESDVRFSSTLVYRSDVLVFQPGRLPRGMRRVNLVPDLIVEILSPSNRPLDLVTKRNDYERFGVGEYWIIDPENASVRCW